MVKEEKNHETENTFYKILLAAGGNNRDGGNSIALDSAGRILVSGFSRNSAGDADMAIWRYMP